MTDTYCDHGDHFHISRAGARECDARADRDY